MKLLITIGICILCVALFFSVGILIGNIVAKRKKKLIDMKKNGSAHV